jgi:hypothetical protein
VSHKTRTVSRRQHYPPPDRGQVERMKEMRSAGALVSEIAASVGVSSATVSALTRGLQPRNRHTSARAVAAHSHNKERDEELVRRVREGESMKAVADAYGLSRERVRQIIVGWEKRNSEIIPRLRERGVPTVYAPPPSAAQRLLSRAVLNRATECWEWTGGYECHRGRAYPVASKQPKAAYCGERYAKRASYRMWVGEIQEDRRIVNACGNDSCISPFHLAAVSVVETFRTSDHWDKVRDTWKHSGNKMGFRREVCVKGGHPMNGSNVYVAADGSRRCRACVTERRRKSRKGPM